MIDLCEGFTKVVGQRLPARQDLGADLDPPDCQWLDRSTVRATHTSEIVIGSCTEFEKAWVFGYNTRRFYTGRDFMVSFVGNGPVVVPKLGGNPFFGSAASPIENQLMDL